MNWVYRILASLLVIAVLIGVAAISEDNASSKPAAHRSNNVPSSDDDSSMKGMKIN